MVVGKTENVIRFSKNIFEDNFFNNTVVFGDTQFNVNNFIVQNTISSDQQFILLDTKKKFKKKKKLPDSIIKLDFTSEVFFDPFKYVKEEKDIKILTNTLLSSYKILTKQTDFMNLHKGLVYFMSALIGFSSLYFENPSIQGVCELAKFWKEHKDGRNLLDKTFEEKLEKSIGMISFPIKNYCLFKLLPIQIQKEAAEECIIILSEINNRRYFKKENKNEIDMEYINNLIDKGKSIIIMPNDEICGRKFSVEEYLIAMIMENRKSLELSKTIIFPLSEGPSEDINKIHLIIDAYDKIQPSQIFKKSLCFFNWSISVTIINENMDALDDPYVLNFFEREFYHKNAILFSSKNTTVNEFILNKNAEFISSLPEINKGEVMIVKNSDIDHVPPEVNILIDDIFTSNTDLDSTISIYHTSDNSLKRNSNSATWKF